MTKKRFEKEDCCDNHHGHWKHNHGSNAVYGLGFIGAVIYFLSTSTGFWMGVLGILKAIVWPAFLVFQLLKTTGI
jgi:hypothetical protein